LPDPPFCDKKAIKCMGIPPALRVHGFMGS
jgi:hypothetical protein